MSVEAEDFVRTLQKLRIEIKKLCRELQRLDEQIKLVKEGENGERGG